MPRSAADESILKKAAHSRDKFSDACRREGECGTNYCLLANCGRALENKKISHFVVEAASNEHTWQNLSFTESDASFTERGPQLWMFGKHWIPRKLGQLKLRLPMIALLAEVFQHEVS